jgi:hypothetical protein
MSNEIRQQLLERRKSFRNRGSDQPSTNIDYRTGAPASVRAAAGAAYNQRDKLATVQKMLDPNAYMQGEDIIFKDPKTGRETAYNEKGLSFGDIASLGGEMAEVLGAAGGATLATPSGPLGMVAGAGLGAAIGREGYQGLAQNLLGTVDTRNLGQRAADAFMTAATDIAGQGVGQVVGRGLESGMSVAKNVLGRPSRQYGRQAVQDFIGTNTPMTVAGVTGSPTAKVIESTVGGMLGGAGRMGRIREQQVNALETELEKVSRSFGKPLSPSGAGEVIERGARGAADRMESRIGKLSDDLVETVGRDRPVDLTPLEIYAQTANSALQRAPQSRASDISPALKEAQKILDDASESGVYALDDLRQVRSRIGRQLEDYGASGPSKAESPALRQLYGTLTQVIKSTADQVPGGKEAFDRFNRYTRYQKSINAPFLDEIVKKKYDQDAFRAVMQGSKDGRERIARLRANLKPEEFDTVAATVLEQAGRPVASQRIGTELADEDVQFSIQTFLKNWENMDRGARRALFSGKRYQNIQPELDRLVRAAERVRAAGAFENVSRTGGNVLAGTGGLLAAEQAVSGNLGNAAMMVMTSYVAPRSVATLMTSPKFVKWLAGASFATSPKAGKDQLARLAQIAAEDQLLKPAIADFEASLRNVDYPGLERYQ